MFNKLVFLIIILNYFLPVVCGAYVIDTFDRAEPASFYSTEIGAGTGGTVLLSFSDSEYVAGNGSMKIFINVPKVNTWSGWNAVYHYYGKTTLQDWSEFGEYFVFDMKAVTQSTDVRIILNLKDSDEEWQSQRGIISSQWTQYVFEIKKATGANPDYALNTDGFYRPSWVTPGNDDISLDTIYGFLFTFSAPGSIEGNFYIDNFKIVKPYEITIPEKMSIVNKNIKQIKIFFGPKVIGNTATNIKINGTTMSSYFSTEFNAVICDIPYELADNTDYTITIPDTIQIATTIPMSLPSYSYQFKTGGTMTLGSYDIYRTLQLEDGTSINISKEASTNNITFSIEKLDTRYTGNPLFNRKLHFIGYAYKFNPENVILNSSAIIKIFYDDSNITDENNLRIFRETPTGWKAVSSIVHETANYIEASVNKLGVFAIIQDDDFYNEVLVGSFDGLSSNPFTPNGDGINDIVKLYYSVYKSGCIVYFKILTTDGVVVKKLVENVTKNEGAYVVEWDGKAEVGDFVSGGIYLYELRIIDADDLNNSQIYHGAISVIRK